MLRARIWFACSGDVFSCVLECVGLCVTSCALSCSRVRGGCCRDGVSCAAHSRHALRCWFEQHFEFLCDTVFFDSPSAQCDRSSRCSQVLMCTCFYLVRAWQEPVQRCASSRVVLRSRGQGKIGGQNCMILSGVQRLSYNRITEYGRQDTCS